MLLLKFLYVEYNFINVRILNLVLFMIFFWAVLLSDNRDDCMRSGFITLHKAIAEVYSQFFLICT